MRICCSMTMNARRAEEKVSTGVEEAVLQSRAASSDAE